MIETIFYLQILLLAIFSILGIIYRSPAFFMFASVLAFSTAVMLAGEGVSFFNGWDGTVSGTSPALSFSTSSTYVTFTTESSSQINFWFYGLLVIGFIWLISIFVLFFKNKINF